MTDGNVEEAPKAPAKTKTAKKRSTRGSYSTVDKRLKVLEEKVDDALSRATDIDGKISVVAGGIPTTAEQPEEPSQYMTSREQFAVYSKLVNRREGELADKKLMHMMEQVCAMREDFFKLCAGMEENIGSFTAADVLESFKAYEVDMENILRDAGVEIGQYQTEGNRLNTVHQRIVGVVPTDDPAKNMTIAGRIADGYEYQGRVLLKEKVNVFKTSSKTTQQRNG